MYFRDQYFALDHRHGRYALSSVLASRASVPGTAGFDRRGAVFLDIESGPRSEDSATFAFVVGVGRFEPFYFRLRQLFHREGSAEEGLLTALNEVLESATCVVTFNGRVFDLPYLASRYSATELPQVLQGLPHLDLLQAARQVYGPDLKSRRLATIEERYLGVRRLHGSGWPVGSPHPLLEHNANDVLSLVVLWAHLERHASRLSKHDPRYLVAVGRLHEQHDEPDKAIEALRLAWTLDPCGLAGAQAIARLARMLNARGRWAETVSLWQEELRASPLLERQVHARLELGKLLERRLRNPEAALDLFRQAIDLLERTSSVRKFERSYASLADRVSRLEARLDSMPATSG